MFQRAIFFVVILDVLLYNFQLSSSFDYAGSNPTNLGDAELETLLLVLKFVVLLTG